MVYKIVGINLFVEIRAENFLRLQNLPIAHPSRCFKNVVVDCLMVKVLTAALTLSLTVFIGFSQ